MNYQEEYQKIQLHLDKFNEYPTLANRKILVHDLTMMAGRHEFEKLTIIINKEIYQETDENCKFKDIIIGKYPYTKNHLFRKFVIIRLYPIYTKILMVAPDKSYSNYNGFPVYLKYFNPKTGEFEISHKMEEAACLFNKETIDKFHEMLTKQPKEIITSEAEINGKKCTKIEISGGWQVSKVIHYDAIGQEVLEKWYYPTDDYNGYASYNEI